MKLTKLLKLILSMEKDNYIDIEDLISEMRSVVYETNR